MEIRHFKYFLTLADELHFGKAAEKLFISQPPLSRMIKALEDELEVPLFNRNNKKVELTSYGEFLRNKAEQILLDIDNIKSQLKILKEDLNRQIRIGYIAAVMYSILPNVLDKFQSQNPSVNILLTEMDNDSLIKSLLSNELDLAFLRTQANFKHITFKHIYDEPFSLILSEKHALAKNKTVTLRELKNEHLITFTKKCKPIQGINNIFAKENIKPNISHQTTQINSILRLVESNVGYSVVPSTVLSAYNLKLKKYDLSHYNETTPLYIGYKNFGYLKVLEDFIKTIEACIIK